MFLRDDIIGFMNKMINMNDADTKIKNNIEEFCNYLRLTKMIDNDTVLVVNKTIECLPEILTLKKKLGYIDITAILENVKSENQTRENKPKRVYRPTYEEKHYHHYQEDTSTSCGSSVSRSSC